MHEARFGDFQGGKQKTKTETGKEKPEKSPLENPLWRIRNKNKRNFQSQQVIGIFFC